MGRVWKPYGSAAVQNRRRGGLRCGARSLFVARGFFFFGQRLVPNILAEPKARIRRFGFAFADFAALVQKFLNKRIIGGFFFDMFHRRNLAGAPSRGNNLTLPF